jgi:hypothetical protein
MNTYVSLPASVSASERHHLDRLVRAFDEGRAAAMQSLTDAACLYLFKTEAEQGNAWLAGHQSFGLGPDQVREFRNRLGGL